MSNGKEHMDAVAASPKIGQRGAAGPFPPPVVPSPVVQEICIVPIDEDGYASDEAICGCGCGCTFVRQKKVPSMAPTDEDGSVKVRFNFELIKSFENDDEQRDYRKSVQNRIAVQIPFQGWLRWEWKTKTKAQFKKDFTVSAIQKWGKQGDSLAVIQILSVAWHLDVDLTKQVWLKAFEVGFGRSIPETTPKSEIIETVVKKLRWAEKRCKKALKKAGTKEAVQAAVLSPNK